jgi:Tol biopolymer transport system component
MNRRKLTTTQIFVAAFLLCGLMIIHTPAAPTLRANGKIAFTSDRDGNSEIYLMNDDGTGQTRLTNSPDREDYPTWSPDGSKIAFMKQKEGVFSINLMNADGTNQTELTMFTIGNTQPYPYERFGMSWSPDGTKIAFQDSTDIFTINVDGSNRINLTNGQFFNYEPSWSPDGSRIAFARSVYSHGFYPQVYIMDKNGENVTRITYCQFYCENRSPVWSPDGGKIAIVYNGEDDSYTSLVNPDGTNVQHIASNTKPKWSPDGTKIVSYSTTYPNLVSQIWVMNRNGSGLTQLTNSSPNNFHPDWQPLAVVNVANIEELYSAVNNSANAGNQIIIAPGVYFLSVNDPNGAARPNAGRLELQENMSLRGVVGERGAVIIDAINLPLSSFNNAAPIPLTAAIRMGRGTNAIEWLTVRNAVNGNANIGTELASTSTNIRVAHVASTNSQRGLDVRNFGAAQIGRVINAEIIDNDFYNNRIGTLGEGFRIASQQGANGGIINATLAGNRSYNNFQGLIVENNRSNNAVTTVFSSGDRFFENGNGALVGGGLSANMTVANGNTVSFTASGDTFENNNGFNNFDFGGLVIPAGENTSIPNGTSNNTVNVELRNCRFSNNQIHDIAAFGARSNPASVGMPGTNNHVRIKLIGTLVPVFETTDSVPGNPAWMNSVTVIRSPVTSNFDYDGDGRADLSVFRPSDQTWYLNRVNGGFDAVRFGLATDKLAPADFDGDGKTDIAVYRAGTWYLQRSQLGFLGFTFGLPDDVPQPADFDGDGKTEIVVWRPSNATWYVYNLATSQFTSFQLGTSTEKPVVGDYDGDGRADYAVFRPSNGTWYVQRSTAGATQTQFGSANDKIIPADYDGDGKTDFAVFRPSDSNWYIRNSASGNVQIVNWGLGTDALVPADYDGDGKADVAVYRGGIWYIRQTTGAINYVYFGLGSDLPTNQVQ